MPARVLLRVKRAVIRRRIVGGKQPEAGVREERQRWEEGGARLDGKGEGGGGRRSGRDGEDGPEG